MKQEEIRELATADFYERHEEENKQLVKLKLNHAVSPLENPNKIKTYRKIIARLKTELRKRQLEESNKINK